MMCYCCWIWMHLLVIIKTNFRQKKCMLAIKLNFFLMSCLYGAYISIFSLSFPLHWYSFYRFGPHRKGGWLSDKKKICKREREKKVSVIFKHIIGHLFCSSNHISPHPSTSAAYILCKGISSSFAVKTVSIFMGANAKQTRIEPSHTHTQKHIYNTYNMYSIKTRE